MSELGIRHIRTNSCSDRGVIRIGVIVLVGWILVSIPAGLLFGVIVRAGRRSWRAPYTLVEGVNAIRFVELVEVPIVNLGR